MAPAGFLSEADATAADNPFSNGIRNHQDVIIGGISAREFESQWSKRNTRLFLFSLSASS
jgi:hypothetical protein